MNKDCRIRQLCATHRFRFSCNGTSEQEIKNAVEAHTPKKDDEALGALKAHIEKRVMEAEIGVSTTTAVHLLMLQGMKDMSSMLAKSFFDRPTLIVASELLGKFLVRRFEGGQTRALMILETEAYDGPHDRASHASRGRTPRNEVMFGPAGIWYVYLVYGMHHMLNVVTGPEGYPAAVLIRALAGVSGPGRLTRELEVHRVLNARPASRVSGLWIEDRGVLIPRSKIAKAPRVGVDYAGPLWSAKPWRFMLESGYAASLSAPSRQR